MADSLRRNRDFRLLWIGGTAAALGSRITILAVPLLVLRETGSLAQAGLIGSVGAATALVAIIPAGAVVDAVERHRLMRYCRFTGSLIISALAMVVLSGHPATAALVVASIALTVLGALYAPAATAMLRAIVPQEQIGLAMARLQARNAAVQIIGPLLGGLLFGVAPALPFLVNAVAFLGSSCCLLAIRTRSEPAPSETRITRRHVLAGFVFIWRQRYLRSLLIVFGAGMNAAFSALMLVTVTSSAQLDPSGRSSGLIVSIAAAGSLLGALLAPLLRAADRPPHVILTVTCWITTAAVLLFTVISQPVVLGLLLATTLFLSGLGNVASAAEQFRLTPEHLVGRVQSAAIFISMAAQPLGPLGGGLLAEMLGAKTAYLLIAAIIGAIAATMTFTFRALPRDEPAGVTG